MAEDNWGAERDSFSLSLKKNSKLGRPSAGGMKDAQYFQGVAPHAVGNDVGRIRNDQFPSANDPSRAAQPGILAEALHYLGY
jgi:hypothetical protein